jgi:hypothetical protein
MPNPAGQVAPRSDLALTLLRGAQAPLALPDWQAPHRVADVVRAGAPQAGLPDEVNRWRLGNAKRLAKEAGRLAIARRMGIGHFFGSLHLTLIRGGEEVVPLGLASLRVVTTTGVAFIVDAFQNLTEVELFVYHGFGTGGAAEAVGNTGLTTELTTEYVVNSTRPTGSSTEGASGNIYRSVGTLSPDSGGTIAITEHGLFSANAAGTLLDRSLFSAVNVVASSDSLQATYEITFTAGS